MYHRRLALFVLRDRQGRVLLQRRPSSVNTPFDHWGFFGGGIEGDETPEKALVREAKEELGINLETFKFFKRYELKIHEKLYEAFVFTGPLNHLPETLRKQQKEGKNLGLFSYEETKKLKLADADREVLKDLFN